MCCCTLTVWIIFVLQQQNFPCCAQEKNGQTFYGDAASKGFLQFLKPRLLTTNLSIAAVELVCFVPSPNFIHSLCTIFQREALRVNSILNNSRQRRQ